MAESGEGNKGKWSAEAYDFLRLFQRVGSQLYGLLLLQIGWVLLLWLVSKLSSNNGPYVIGIPWYAPTDNGFTFSFRDVALKDIYILGAGVLFIVWLIARRLELFIVRPLLLGLRTLTAGVIWVGFVILLVAALPVWLVLLAVEKYLARRGKVTAEEAKPDTGGESRQATVVPERQRRSSPNQFQATWLFQKIGHATGMLIGILVPHGSIGLAHIDTFSYDEESLAARVPLQLFTEAESRLRANMRVLSRVRPRIIVLPASLRISGPQQARWLRRWLGFDALIWGTYNLTVPAQLWINIAVEAPSPEKVDVAPKVWDLLTPSEVGDYQSAIVEQSSPAQAAVILALALQYAAYAREQRRFTPYPKDLDPFGLYSREIRDSAEAFAIQQLRSLNGPVPWDTPEPRGDKIAILLALDWIKR